MYCSDFLKSLTHSTLLPGWSCTWRKKFHCQGQIRWWIWGRCSSDCSSCCHIWATAARWSWRRTGSAGTRQWWHCSRSLHTGLWGSQCSPHLKNMGLLVRDIKNDDLLSHSAIHVITSFCIIHTPTVSDLYNTSFLSNDCEEHQPSAKSPYTHPL